MNPNAAGIPVVVHGYAAEGDWAQTPGNPIVEHGTAFWSWLAGGHTGSAFFWCPPSKRQSHRAGRREARARRNRRLHRRAR